MTTPTLGTYRGHRDGRGVIRIKNGGLCRIVSKCNVGIIYKKLSERSSVKKWVAFCENVTYL